MEVKLKKKSIEQRMTETIAKVSVLEVYVEILQKRVLKLEERK